MLASFSEPLFIGALRAPGRLFAAPVAGVSNLPWRLLARRAGAGLVFTEMIKARPLVAGNNKTGTLAAFSEEERPVGAQISCADPEWLRPAVEILESRGYDLIDINMGCPARKVTACGEGSDLMREPKTVARLVALVVKSARRVPVTVKMRAGWDWSNPNAPEIAQIAEANGASGVTVHGRTRCQFFEGRANWSIITRVKEAVRIPVTGNGDVRTPQDAERMFRETGCDAVMIARAAFGNPWLFREIRHYLLTGETLPPPSLAERREVLCWHQRRLVALFGEHVAHLLMRKHAAWYSRGLPHRGEANRAMQSMATSADFERLVATWFTGDAQDPPGAAAYHLASEALWTQTSTS
ncbi:MAG: tRNA dihydrouridine synthase DusB [Planctomycetes bacterium]|nr:tRNA dihydrouridine synthase DusB [Planctomycetota bacterium]